MRVTIKDVASDANVSIATVSHVINHTRGVSEEAARRVLESVERLKYYPNQVVGSIRRKRTNTVGLLIPSIANETMSCIANLIQTNLFRNGLSLTVFSSHHDSATEESALRSMLMKRVDAIFAVPSSLSSAALQEVKHTRIPVILLDRELMDGDFDTVRCDNYKGEFMAINYLFRMGHRHIGYIDRMVDLSHSVEQRRGYLDALEANGIPFDDRFMVRAQGHFYQAGVEAAQTLMLRCPEITVIACYVDLIAFGVIRGLLDLGYRVPEDVSVVGYDNMSFTEATWPSLTTVDISLDTLCDSACNLLLRRLEEKSENEEEDAQAAPHEKIILEPRLVLRESVYRRAVL